MANYKKMIQFLRMVDKLSESKWKSLIAVFFRVFN